MRSSLTLLGIGVAIVAAPVVAAPVATVPDPVAHVAATLPGGDSGEVRSRLSAWPGPRVVIGTHVFAAPVALRTPSSGFGTRSDPFGRGKRRHDGVDLPGTTGTPVHAAADGVVIFASAAGSYGNMVVVDHGEGVTTRYAHLSVVEVRPGATVQAGDAIGLMGSTGRSTGSHLHFEVRVDGTPTDPLARLTAGFGGAKAVSPPVVAHWLGWTDVAADRLPTPQQR